MHVFDFPFEDDRSLEVAFEAYGAVKSVKKQTFLSNQNIFNGTRLVDVVLSGVLPRFLMVDGYLCRLWYRGQPLVCNLCAVQGHRSANCPNKDKCRKCGKSGHFAKRSNSTAGPTSNICFTNSQEFASLLTNSELDGNNESTAVRNEQLNVSNENTSANSNERSNEVINNSSANSTVNDVINNNSSDIVSEVINNSTERSNEVINNSTVNEIIYYGSTERSNEVNDTVNESENFVSIVENVVEMKSADVMAGAVAATSGRPLIEVIDEGQAEVSSDEIESFEDSSSSSSLPLVFSHPPPDFADAMDESGGPPKDTSSPPSLPPPPGQVGSSYEGRSLCTKANGSSVPAP